MKRVFMIGILALAGGCASVGELTEPTDIPALVTSYRIAGLEERTGDVATVLDLDDCTEYAILLSVGLSGVSSVAGHFPVRQLVAREFQKVVVGNFRTVMPEEEPRLEVRVISDRMSVQRSWSRPAFRQALFPIRPPRLPLPGKEAFPSKTTFQNKLDG